MKTIFNERNRVLWFGRRTSHPRPAHPLPREQVTIFSPEKLKSHLSRHGWRGACIALAGLAAQCAVAGMAMKGRPRQEVAVRSQKAEEDQSLLADDEGRAAKEKLILHQKGGIEGGKTTSSFLSLPFLALVAANPPAVLGHYTVYMFLPAVSGRFLEYFLPLKAQITASNR